LSTALYFVHPSAVCDPGCIIGDGTKIWHFCHVMSGARIGRDCSFGQNCFVGQGVQVGDRVRVQNNVSLYEGVVLEDDVFCGPSAVFTNVRRPRAAFPRAMREVTRVGRGATIGANATIVCGTVLGEYAFVGAGAVVTHHVAPHALVSGVPAKQVGWVSRAGEELRFGPELRADCAVTGERYQLTASGVCSVDD
jgi:UDP-2-acetamido-3-amino-2,3-dideoxy-glucuronate N-acetyltransferase